MKHEHNKVNVRILVEHIGFEPMTSSMPWKRASQLCQCPERDEYNKNSSPLYRNEFCCFAAMRPPRARFCLNLFVLSRKGYPLCAPALAVLSLIPCHNTSFLVYIMMLILVFTIKLCLNNTVQKHTRIKAKGGRLPLSGKLSSSHTSL
jgi:hypothetical protein